MRTIFVREDLDNPDPQYVELYRAMGARPDVEYWLGLISEFDCKPAILELGCGAGGLARPLSSQGLEVWGVDAHPGMLKLAEELAPPELHLVQSRIEDLFLRRKFDLVILSSHLINTPNQDRRKAIYSAAVRHLEPSGLLALEVNHPGWFSEGVGLDAGSVCIECLSFDPSSSVWTGTVSYLFNDVRFVQQIQSAVLTIGEISNELLEFGLALVKDPVRRNHTDLELVFGSERSSLQKGSLTIGR